MASLEVFNPDNYRLSFQRQSELSDMTELLTNSCLGDLSVYCKHPDWFIKCPKSGRIDYDPRVGPRMILEAKRALRDDERPEELLEERLNELRPDPKAIKAARETMVKFMESVTTCTAKRSQRSTPPAELAYHVADVPDKLGDVRRLSGVLPEPCIRACEDMCAAAIQPCPPEQKWEQAIGNGSKRAVTINERP